MDVWILALAAYLGGTAARSIGPVLLPAILIAAVVPMPRWARPLVVLAAIALNYLGVVAEYRSIAVGPVPAWPPEAMAAPGLLLVAALLRGGWLAAYRAIRSRQA